MPAISGVSHVVLTVNDLDRSIGWYEKVLKAAPIFRGRNDAEGFEVSYLAEPTSGALLGLVRHDRSPGVTFDPRTTGLDHLSFAVNSKADLEQWASHLDAAGIPHFGVRDEPFGAALSLLDPDGIALEFYQLVLPSQN